MAIARTPAEADREFLRRSRHLDLNRAKAATQAVDGGIVSQRLRVKKLLEEIP